MGSAAGSEAPELEVRWGLWRVQRSAVLLTLVLYTAVPLKSLGALSPSWPLQGLAQASAADCRTPHQGGWRL